MTTRRRNRGADTPVSLPRACGHQSLRRSRRARCPCRRPAKRRPSRFRCCATSASIRSSTVQLPLDTAVHRRQRPGRDDSASTSASARWCWRSCTTSARCSARRCSTASSDRSRRCRSTPARTSRWWSSASIPARRRRWRREAEAGFMRRYGRAGAETGRALPDRPAGVDRRADRRGRLPLRLRRGDRPVRASGGDHGAHARRARLALSVRDRVRAARSAARRWSKPATERIGTVVDQALLFCYHYDPETGKYGLAIMNVVRLGGAADGGRCSARSLLSACGASGGRRNAVAETATGIR